MDIILGTSSEDRADLIYEKAAALSEDEKKKILVIVPEQYTLETQKGIIKKHPRRAIMNIDVVSFNRLAYKVLDHCGFETLPIIRETGKNMLTRKVLGKNAAALKYYSPGMRKKGFVSGFKSLLSELDQYACAPDELREIASSFGKEGLKKVSDKLSDIALIYEEYKNELCKRFLTCEDLLSALEKKLNESDFLNNSYVFFDGFTGFTKSQYNIIETIIKKAEYTCFSFCYEGEKLYPESDYADSGNLFFMSDVCIKKLAEISGDNNVNIIFADKETEEKRAPELEFLRHDFFVNPADAASRRDVFKGEVNAVKIFEADDIKEEVSLVIGRIRRLVTDEGYRYKDIAVVMEDIESYGDLTFKLMEQNGFPVFLDRTKSVSANPFIENIRAFLKLVTEGFFYENVFRYIKCGFSPAGDGYIDELDNYCLATGVHSESGWKKEWVRIPGRMKVNEAGEQESYYDLKKLNAVREEIYDHIKKYVNKFRDEKKVSGMLEILKGFLDEDSVTERTRFFLKGALAEETRQTIKKTAALLKETAMLFGDEEMGTDEFADMLDAAFEEMSAGFIPPSNDCIIIGDIDRTRLNNIRALFIVGVNDGVIPKKNSECGILNDADRLRLTGAGLSLSPSVREQAFIQKYYLYLLLTKPFEKLFLSYSRKDIQGKALSESYLIKDLCDSFEALNVSIDGKEDAELSKIKLVQAPEIWLPGKEDIMLGPDTVSALYDGRVSGSISSFESFAGCPFTYFMKKGLHIYPRERYEFNPADFGTIVHDILYGVLKTCTERKIQVHTLDDKAREAFVEAELAKAAEDYYILSDNERNLFVRARIRQLAMATLKAVGYQLAGGAFVPHGFEKRFAVKRDIPEGTLEFSGIIDRSDICISGDEVYLRIVDYKTGANDFDLNRFYHGRQLQLVSYMNAAENELKGLYPGKNIIPSALLYMMAKNPFATEEAKKLDEKDIDEQIRSEFAMKGVVANDDISLVKNDSDMRGDIIDSVGAKKGVPSAGKGSVNREQMELLQKYAGFKTVDIAGRILSGEAWISPLEESGGQVPRPVCGFCDYRDVCNYTPELAVGRRSMRKCKDDEIWEKMKDELS